MLPAATRWPQSVRLIEQQAYFVLHALRQTGKTTALLALARELTASGCYVAALLSMEVGAPFSDDPGQAEATILGSWRDAADFQLPSVLCPPNWPQAESGQRIQAVLRSWAQSAPRPLVVFIDEIDALQDATLISMLRQLRDGYWKRPTGFPWSLALCGLRDVRDYKVASGGSQGLYTASPFNIKGESLTLKNFTAQEVSALYNQHTGESGQRFTPEAQVHAFHLTQGQPWMVNRLAYIAVEDLVPERKQPITAEHIEQAKKEMIQRRDTHLDSLAEKLREPRVRQVIEPILAGQALGDLPGDDQRYVLDLGLVRQSQYGGLEIANPVYKEIIPRELSFTAQNSLLAIQPTWLTVDGRLDPTRLLDAFLSFWRQHGQPLLATSPYSEVAAQIVLLAFWQRVTNGVGVIDREYAIGARRMDLLVRYGE
jgi:hypothetical protein